MDGFDITRPGAIATYAAAPLEDIIAQPVGLEINQLEI
tara:strand:- start:2719 stop:2832 length:114 start_codon:yes stop_codon:yes gene_type:complete